MVRYQVSAEDSGRGHDRPDHTNNQILHPSIQTTGSKKLPVDEILKQIPNDILDNSGEQPPELYPQIC